MTLLWLLLLGGVCMVAIALKRREAEVTRLEAFRQIQALPKVTREGDVTTTKTAGTL